MSGPTRINILGVPVDCVDMQGALDIVDASIKSDSHLIVLAVNPEKVMVARSDPATMASLQKAGLLIPDGIGVVWAARMLAGEPVGRVPGAELMPEICGLAASKGYKVFLYGAAPDIVDRACIALKEVYPSLEIAGTQHGFVSEEEMPAFIDRINISAADVLFVALGSPRQELWIESHAPMLNIKVYQGVGGTFNVLAGEVKRAPAIFCKAHFEWFYRLIAEPKRISRQIVIPVFVVKVIWQKLRQSLS